MTTAPPVLRKAVHDGILTMQQAEKLTPYLETAAPTQPLQEVTKLSTKIGAWIGMALAAALCFAIAAGLITGIAVAVVGAWRWITGL